MYDKMKKQFAFYGLFIGVFASIYMVLTMDTSFAIFSLPFFLLVWGGIGFAIGLIIDGIIYLKKHKSCKIGKN